MAPRTHQPCCLPLSLLPVLTVSGIIFISALYPLALHSVLFFVLPTQSEIYHILSISALKQKMLLGKTEKSDPRQCQPTVSTEPLLPTGNCLIFQSRQVLSHRIFLIFPTIPLPVYHSHLAWWKRSRFYNVSLLFLRLLCWEIFKQGISFSPSISSQMKMVTLSSLGLFSSWVPESTDSHGVSSLFYICFQVCQFSYLLFTTSEHPIPWLLFCLFSTRPPPQAIGAFLAHLEWYSRIEMFTDSFRKFSLHTDISKTGTHSIKWQKMISKIRGELRLPKLFRNPERILNGCLFITILG